MSAPSSRSLRELFLAASEIEDQTARAVFLAEVCGNDDQLRRRVEELVAAEQEAGGAPVRPGAAGSHPGEVIGSMIGRYKLLEQLGEGGCGVVYMAEQQEPVRRRVALKVIKLGMDTRSVIARFEAERQALALMDHPNIAKVLDAGATDTGRPYFVMELVGGIKVTDYCEQNHLDTRQRLNLFIQVCRAVQHAHQKGIIHRDLKPSNVLVATQDGVPIPKVIDFGIAKATQGRLTDQTVFTAFEQFLGTPAYMSPEQAQVGGLDVDTRSDIYSLGVLLYELLTGKTPFDTKELLAAGLDAMRRMIQEKEPPTPSTRLTQSLVAADARRLKLAPNSRGPEPAAGSLQSETDRASLCRLLQEIRGDLDWIVMKCLEKDRGRRYETANGLAMDIERHLNDEPVVAGPPGAAYRLSKLIRRHKGAVAAVVAIAAALVLGMLATAWEARQQRHLRQQAQTAQAAEVRQRQKAETEASKSQQVARLLEEMLQSVGPSVAKGRDVSMLREILDKTAERAGQELTNQPYTQIEIGSVLVNTYHELGLYARMEAQARQNLRLARSLPEPDNPYLAAALAGIGDALQHQGSFQQAEQFTREALTLYCEHLGNEHHRVAYTLNDLASILRGQGKLAEAESAAREAVRINKKVYGDEHQETASTLNNLAEVLRDENKLEEAERIWRQVLPLQKKLLGDEHPACIISLINLGGVLQLQGKAAEAERLERQALGIGRKVLREEHPHLATCLAWLTGALKDQRKLPEAEATAREALARRRKMGNEQEKAVALNTLGSVLAAQNRAAEAEETYRAALKIQRKLWPGAHPDIAAVLGNLAGVLRAQSKLAEAEEVYREALTMARSLQGNNYEPVLGDLRGLAGVLQKQGKWDDAEPLLQEVIEVEGKRVGPGRAEVAVARHNLGFSLQQQGKLAEAEELLREALASFRAAARKEPPEELVNLAIVLHHLADVLREEKTFTEARSLAEESVEMYRRHPEMSRTEKQHALQVLVDLLTDLDDYSASESVFQELLKDLRARLPADDPEIANELVQRAFALFAKGKYSEAEPPAQECLKIREAKARGDWRTFSTRSLLGGCLLGQQKYAEAEPLLVSGYQGLKEHEAAIPELGRPRMKEALQRLVELCERTNRPDQAAQWKKKLQEFEVAQVVKQPSGPP